MGDTGRPAGDPEDRLSESGSPCFTSPPQFEGKPIRITGTPNDPWFVAIDVCAVLGIGNTSMAVGKLEKDYINLIEVTDSLGRQRLTTIISESGL